MDVRCGICVTDVLIAHRISHNTHLHWKLWDLCISAVKIYEQEGKH
jgi:hypothetical protein